MESFDRAVLRTKSIVVTPVCSYKLCVRACMYVWMGKTQRVRCDGCLGPCGQVYTHISEDFHLFCFVVLEPENPV